MAGARGYIKDFEHWGPSRIRMTSHRQWRHARKLMMRCVEMGKHRSRGPTLADLQWSVGAIGFISFEGSIGWITDLRLAWEAASGGWYFLVQRRMACLGQLVELNTAPMQAVTLL